MTDEKDFQELTESLHKGADMNNPDYLQETSSLIATLGSKPSEIKLSPDMPYSEQYDAMAKNHIAQVEQTLAQARSQGDYGVPEIGSTGEPLQGDIPFLETPSELPEELKKED